MKNLLLIGGTDPSGAGLQTDWAMVNHLNSRFAFKTYSVVTAITAQNNSVFFAQGLLPYGQVKAQLESLAAIEFEVIKIGMLGDENILLAVLEFIQAHAQHATIILDPVLHSSSGGKLLTSKGQTLLRQALLPLISLITPNIAELAALTDERIETTAELEQAAKKLHHQGAKAVLVKGGHFEATQSASSDFFINAQEQFYLSGKRWQNRSNVRGTGCALGSAIGSLLCAQFSLTDAIVFAKATLNHAIQHATTVDEAANTHQLHYPLNSDYHPFNQENMPRLYKSKTSFESPRMPSIQSKRLGIYPVVDSVEWIKKLVPQGIKTLQLRIKDQAEAAVEADIIEAIEYAKAQQVRLFINDYWQLALKHQAYGIHLGQEDLDTANLAEIAASGCRLGVSTHSYTEMARALAIAPSYIALGPIYATTSKDMPWIPQGVNAVKHWVELLGDDYPLVAIGGINAKRAQDLKPTGVGSIAMISAITQAPNYAQACQELLAIWD